MTHLLTMSCDVSSELKNESNYLVRSLDVHSARSCHPFPAIPAFTDDKYSSARASNKYANTQGGVTSQ